MSGTQPIPSYVPTVYIDLARVAARGGRRCDPDTKDFQWTDRVHLDEPPLIAAARLGSTGAFRRVNMAAYEHLYYTKEYLSALSSVDGLQKAKEVECAKGKYVPEYEAFRCRSYWLHWDAHPGREPGTPPFPQLVVSQAPRWDDYVQLLYADAGGTLLTIP